MTMIARFIALPLLSAGILGGALGPAGTAAAQVASTTPDHSFVVGSEKAHHAQQTNPYKKRHQYSENNAHFRHR